MRLRLSVFILCMVLVLPALARQSPNFPQNSKFVIQLTSSQFASGIGNYLVPPLLEAFRRTGITYTGGSDADFAATVQTRSDVGKWHGKGSAAVRLYSRFVTVGLSPANVDIEVRGRLTPRFSVTVKLVTPNQEKVDELSCLIGLATRELARRYKVKGHIKLNGKSCLTLKTAPRAADVCKRADPRIAGTYNLRGVMETGSVIRLAADGRFNYMLTVGAYDEVAKGCWRRNGNTLLLSLTKARNNLGQPSYKPLKLKIDTKGRLIRSHKGKQIGVYVRMRK
ncbi:MAG: hypothetical protein GY952_02080 [Rhodobacteraceae bacterium]|nr:hypothetical protein [Paracoccaceae bacterium]